MNTNSILYSLKIWLTSVALAPLIFLIIESLTKDSHSQNLEDYIYMGMTMYAAFVIFGTVFSFFTWVLFILIIKGIITLFSWFRQIKLVIASVGVLLSVATFAILLPTTDLNIDIIYLMISNCVCIAGGSLYYKLEIIEQA